MTERIIKMIESGVNPWDHGFSKAATMLPVNGQTKKQYNGMNIFNLSIAQADEDFEHNIWFTYNQAKKMGGNVKSGSKSVVDVYFFKLINKRDEAEDAEFTRLQETRTYNDRYHELAKKVFMIARSAPVFNYDQVENIPFEKVEDLVPAAPETFGNTPIEACENIIENMRNKPAIEFGTNQPAYNPKRDLVKMPELERYQKAERFYKTMFHELAHATGHESRLGRDGIVKFNGFGSEQYSFEELVAELSASFISKRAGLDDDELDENTAAYLKGWIEPLQNDTRMIVKAMTKAIDATEYILETE